MTTSAACSEALQAERKTGRHRWTNLRGVLVALESIVENDLGKQHILCQYRTTHSRTAGARP
eukprot:3297610-Rhodomonas_salina.2